MDRYHWMRSILLALILVGTCRATAQKKETDTLQGSKEKAPSEWSVGPEEKEIFSREYSPEAETPKDSTEYEVIVFDPGFNVWLQSVARPRGYYSQSFMEQRNLILVNEWNVRFQNPRRFEANLYENRINYEAGVDYGYEVNYVLYNYFLYFQRKNGIQLTSFRPSLN